MIPTTRSRYIAYLFEGVILSILIASMSLSTPHLAEKITGDKENQWVHWTSNVFIGIVTYIIAESFRHGRISVIISSINPSANKILQSAKTGFGASPAVQFSGDNQLFRRSL